MSGKRMKLPDNEHPHFVLGDWNAECAECGITRKASMLERNWQGYYVCPNHNEPRHAQDFVTGIPDRVTTSFVQEYPDILITEISIVPPNPGDIIP
jgi:hypothetical protein